MKKVLGIALALLSINVSYAQIDVEGGGIISLSNDEYQIKFPGAFLKGKYSNKGPGYFGILKTTQGFDYNKMCRLFGFKKYVSASLKTDYLHGLWDPNYMYLYELNNRSVSKFNESKVFGSLAKWPLKVHSPSELTCKGVLQASEGNKEFVRLDSSDEIQFDEHTGQDRWIQNYSNPHIVKNGVKFYFNPATPQEVICDRLGYNRAYDAPVIGTLNEKADTIILKEYESDIEVIKRSNLPKSSINNRYIKRAYCYNAAISKKTEPSTNSNELKEELDDIGEF